MKKLIIAVLLVTGIAASAQDNPSENKLGQEKRERMSPEQRSQALLNRMTKELNLDTKQQELIKPILAEQTAKMEVMRAQRMAATTKELTLDERKAMQQKRKEDRATTESKLKAILTPEQFKKLKEIEAVRR